jgi:ribose/xylose/arabinose/galactoside ABC-type transport system permease subunit
MASALRDARVRLEPMLGHRLARSRAEGWWEILFVPSALVVLGIVLTSTSPEFLTSLNLTNILQQGSDLAAISFGVTFVMLAGDLDLSVGAGAALTSAVGAYVMKDTNSVALGAAAGIGLGLGIGLINGVVVTKLRAPSFIATLGMMVIARGVALALTNGSVVTGLPNSAGNLASNNFLGIPWIVWIVFVVLFLILYFVQSQTAFGVRVFAVGGNREAARLSAIAVDRVRIACFALSGITMGIGGLVLTTRVQSGQPNAGQWQELYAVAAIVLGGTSLYGGKGSLVRTLWGVLFIVTLQNGLDLNAVGDDLKQVVIGSVLIAAASTDFLRTQLRRRRTIREEAAAEAALGSRAASGPVSPAGGASS